MVNASIRYGVSLRKRYMAVQKEKKARYKCDVCGRLAVKRISTGIWKCKHCGATYAGGAYTLKTSAGETANRIIMQYLQSE
ncbi:MAG: 50S ribosomal protein L37ae [Candidatus Micrarchaeia archaeon]